MGCDVLERPLQVLVRGQVTGQHSALLATDAQQAVVNREHCPIVRHNLTVIVIRSDGWVGERERGKRSRFYYLYWLIKYDDINGLRFTHKM